VVTMVVRVEAVLLGRRKGPRIPPAPVTKLPPGVVVVDIV
jgi:hypothetical protein